MIKYLGLTLVSIVWLLSTVVLAISFIGILALLVHDGNNSYWFSYGRKLINELTNKTE